MSYPWSTLNDPEPDDLRLPKHHPDEPKWREYERRNPGVEHPGRTEARRKRQIQQRHLEYKESTEDFRPVRKTVAQFGVESRRRQRRN